MIATREAYEGETLIGQTTRTEARVRARRLERGKVLAWLSLAIPLAVSAVLNLWNLSQNGYSNEYYSVAVQSMQARHSKTGTQQVRRKSS